MSSSKQQSDAKRAADRRAAAMKKSFTKVKPTVVKHILPNEVLSAQDTKVSSWLTNNRSKFSAH